MLVAALIINTPVTKKASEVNCTDVGAPPQEPGGRGTSTTIRVTGGLQTVTTILY
jgi:hypothetical protein